MTNEMAQLQGLLENSADADMLRETIGLASQRLMEMEVGTRAYAFLNRPIEGDWPYLWIDATYVKVRQEGRIVSVAAITAVGVNVDDRHEVLGMDIGASEAKPFWTAFLRSLTRRGLHGVKLLISDNHSGIRAAVIKVLTASCQRCQVHFMRDALAHAGRRGKRVVAAFGATAFAQDTAQAAKEQWGHRRPAPALGALTDYTGGPLRSRRTGLQDLPCKLHSTNPIERLNHEVKRSADVVGIFPNEAGIRRLIGAVLLEQNDEWGVQCARYMPRDTMADLLIESSTNELPVMAN